MLKRTKLIAAICMLAEAFTSLVLFFVYANRKKELSKVFLGLGILGGVGGGYLLYRDFVETKKKKAAYSDWDDESDEIAFDEVDPDDINFTIADDELEALGEDLKEEPKEETKEETKE